MARTGRLRRHPRHRGDVEDTVDLASRGAGGFDSSGQTPVDPWPGGFLTPGPQRQIIFGGKLTF